MKRRTFLSYIAGLPIAGGVVSGMFNEKINFNVAIEEKGSFSSRLKPLNRILEMEDWYVWGTSAIVDEFGKTHVFFSRWEKSNGWRGWIFGCEIAHAIADTPEGPYTFLESVLKPSGGKKWDANTCHNPTIHKIGDQYVIYYIGWSGDTISSQSIGMAVADSLNGPWKKSGKPLLEGSHANTWDNLCASNPSYLLHPNGQSWLYYKSANKQVWDKSGAVFKFGLAISEKPVGPYHKYENNPVIDITLARKGISFEDPYFFYEEGKFKMICRDMGYFDHEVGLYFESEDGIHWSKPEIAFYGSNYYKVPDDGHDSPELFRRNRFERPQVLMQNGKATHLFCALQGGKYGLSSNFVFRID